jgi:hypothetical protein
MWIETIVMPREEPAHYNPSPRYDRAAAQQEACAQGHQFRDAVLGFLQTHELMDAVRWVSEPGSIPLVTLHCTSTVLERLQKEPRFEAGRSLAITGLTGVRE